MMGRAGTTTGKVSNAYKKAGNKAFDKADAARDLAYRYATNADFSDIMGEPDYEPSPEGLARDKEKANNFKKDFNDDSVDLLAQREKNKKNNPKIDNESLSEGKEKSDEKKKKVKTVNGVTIYECEKCGKFSAKINGKEVKKKTLKQIEKAIKDATLDEDFTEASFTVTGPSKVDITSTPVEAEPGTLAIDPLSDEDRDFFDNGMEEPVDDFEDDFGDEFGDDFGDEFGADFADDLGGELDADDLLSDEEEPIEEEPEEEEKEEDVEEFEESYFNQLGTKFLQETYGNVKEFNTKSASVTGNTLILEGIIKFKSGKSKESKFKFEAKDITPSGHARFLGENLAISRGKKSFTLAGTLKNKKFIPESLTYNYRAKDTNGASQRVYGRVKVD